MFSANLRRHFASVDVIISVVIEHMFSKFSKHLFHFVSGIVSTINFILSDCDVCFRSQHLHYL